MNEIGVGSMFPNAIDALDVRQLNALLREFSPKAAELRIEDVRAIARDDYLFVAREDSGDIVGMTTLIVYRKPTGLVGQVEDVIVTERCRGMHISRQLMGAVIETAKRLRLKHLALTSNPRRIAARSLYSSLGFEIKDTSCFVLKL